jgi:hypothetical protein
VYVPFLTEPAPLSAPFTGLRDDVDIVDANTGRLRARVMPPEAFAMLAAEVDGLPGRFLTMDENGQRLFALTIPGSGFQNGVAVTANGSARTVSFVDMNTLKITLPTVSSDPQNLSIANPTGESISIDAALNVN